MSRECNNFKYIRLQAGSYGRQAIVRFLHIRILLFICLFLLTAFPASAHVTADMPDPIAEVEYQMMLDFEPDDLLTRYKLAMVYYRLEKDKQAEIELQSVLKKDNNNFLALEGLGMLLVRQKRYDIAVTTLLKAAHHQKRESGTYFYLAKALMGIGKTEQAQAYLATGLDLCKSEPLKKRAVSIKQFQDTIAANKPKKIH